MAAYNVTKIGHRFVFNLAVCLEKTTTYREDGDSAARVGAQPPYGWFMDLLTTLVSSCNTLFRAYCEAVFCKKS